MNIIPTQGEGGGAVKANLGLAVKKISLHNTGSLDYDPNSNSERVATCEGFQAGVKS